MISSIIAASLLFTEPAPLEMPLASAYVVRDEESQLRLEDRYKASDLWYSRELVGRWADADGRIFLVARLDAIPPVSPGETVTRTVFTGCLSPIDVKDVAARDAAARHFLPFDMPDEIEPEDKRNNIDGMKEAIMLHGADEEYVACLFLPEKSSAWYLACWKLVEGDDHEYAVERFEDEILREWASVVKKDLRTEKDYATRKPLPKKASAEKRKIPPERELLRADVRHNLANYPDWNVTDGEEFTIADDLPYSSRKSIVALTNDMQKMRARYAKVMPAVVTVTNSLCVARLFKNRDEYQAALKVTDQPDMSWSAGYWCPWRRELVTHLPPQGFDQFLRCVRHEAFHQYLSYACAMNYPSPWFNEGYAEYFEDEDSPDWGMEVDLDQVAELLPGLLQMESDEFYAGTDIERHLKYRMAWSIAYFLEKGADKVSGKPYKNVKRNYIATLVKTHDMHKATDAAFAGEAYVEKFVAAWLKFWKKL